jgi:hypothetical protein
MPSTTLKFDVFGRLMLAEHIGSGWRLFDLRPEGKRTLVTDLVVPDFISASEIDQYLADMFHERASDKHPAVSKLDE